MLSLVGTLVTSFSVFLEDDTLVNILKIIDPLYVISGGGTELTYIVKNDDPTQYVTIETGAFIATIINNLVYAALFYVGGAFIFMKRDVK